MKLVHLWRSDGAGLDEGTIRDAAEALCEEATSGGEVVQGDAIYEEVTEGRQTANTEQRAVETRLYGAPKSVSYSSCGDLPHWMLEHLGYTNEGVVNRSDDDGVRPWKAGVNISYLVYETGGAFKKPTVDKKIFSDNRQNNPTHIEYRYPKKGDIGYLSPPDHVGVFGEIGEFVSDKGCSVAEVVFYEYGQFDKEKGKFAGCKHTYTLSVSAAGYSMTKVVDGVPHTRQLMGWVDTYELLYNDQEHLIRATMPDTFTGGVVATDPDPLHPTNGVGEVGLCRRRREVNSVCSNRLHGRRLTNSTDSRRDINVANSTVTRTERR